MQHCWYQISSCDRILILRRKWHEVNDEIERLLFSGLVKKRNSIQPFITFCGTTWYIVFNWYDIKRYDLMRNNKAWCEWYDWKVFVFRPPGEEKKWDLAFYCILCHNMINCLIWYDIKRYDLMQKNKAWSEWYDGKVFVFWPPGEEKKWGLAFGSEGPFLVSFTQAWISSSSSLSISQDMSDLISVIFGPSENEVF